jgi:hypothetical protein
MRMKEIAEYEHPTDYVVIPVVMRDRIMARLNAAEARVRELEGALREIAHVRSHDQGYAPQDTLDAAITIVERVLHGEDR